MGDLGGFLSKPEVVRCTRQQRGGGAQDQNQGGHCHFPNERWVGVSTKKQALTHSVDTHTHTIFQLKILVHSIEKPTRAW